MSFDIAKLRRPDWVSEDVLIFQYDEILTAMVKNLKERTLSQRYVMFHILITY